MQPTSLVRQSIWHVSVSDIAVLYGEWVTGTGNFNKDRQDRLKKGVPVDLDPATAALEGGDFRNGNRCYVRVRTDGSGYYLLHWFHLDVADASVEWHTIVRLERNDNGAVSLEHLCARRGVDHLIEASPIAVSPKVIRFIIGEYGEAVAEKELLTKPVGALRARDIDAFVRYILLDPERSLPIVIVATQETVRVDFSVDKLASSLFGMVQVYKLTSGKAATALGRSLSQAGFPGLGCYDGAVRVYNADLISNSNQFDHALLLPWRIRSMPRKSREMEAGGYILSRITRVFPQDLALSTITRIDTRAWETGVEQVVQSTEYLELQDKLHEATSFVDYYGKENEKLEKRIRDLENLYAQVKNELDQERHEADVKAVASFDVENVHQALKVAMGISATLQVLPSALGSARECTYEDPGRVFRVLMTVASSYGGEAFNLQEALRRSFGKQAKWKVDGEVTLKKFSAERTFLLNGRRELFSEHITIGHGQNERRCMQIYLKKAEGGRSYVVGYVGKHLRTVSRDA